MTVFEFRFSAPSELREACLFVASDSLCVVRVDFEHDVVQVERAESVAEDETDSFRPIGFGENYREILSLFGHTLRNFSLTCY